MTLDLRLPYLGGPAISANNGALKSPSKKFDNALVWWLSAIVPIAYRTYNTVGSGTSFMGNSGSQATESGASLRSSYKILVS